LQTLLHPPAHQELVISEQRHHEETPELTVQETVQEPVAAELSITEVKAEIYEEQVSSLPEVEKPDMKEDPQEVQAAEPVATEEPPVVFEPYHTIDYFASQGIRISNEIKPDDPLGQRLKSFTEWLKTMKRLPQTRVDEQLDEVTQQNIQDFASHSLDEKEVVTETMAEVLVKQHKEEEAVVIYEKLSLLNPSKRAYFAAKIEQLKGQ
jgi:hypothetical protein